MPSASFVPSLPSDLADYPQVVTVGPGGHFQESQVAVDSILDSSITKPYVVLILPSTQDLPDTLNMKGTSGLKDYIHLRGYDRWASMVRRLTSPGSLSPVVQACAHGTISNMTVYSDVSRLIHWDTIAGAALHVDGVNLLSPLGGQGGVSAGGSGGNKLLMTNCFSDNAPSGCHGGLVGDGSALDVWISSCQWTNMSGGILGFDLAAAAHPTRLSIHGCSARFFNVDPVYIDILMPTDGTKTVEIFTDMPANFVPTADPNLKFFNSFVGPQQRRYTSSSITLEGDCVVYDHATDRITTTATANAPFPAVVAVPDGVTGISGWYPALVTGPHAAVKVLTAQAVALGDIIVTSATAGQATVNNSQTDPTKILGWAISTKAGAVAGRVNLQRNMLVGF